VYIYVIIIVGTEKRARETEDFMERNKNDKVIILGKEIDEENFPKLYDWARVNPDTLEKNIKRRIKEKGNKNLYDVMIALEKEQNLAERLFITGHN